MAVPSDQFARSLVRAERRLLIYSVCLMCGEGKMVSESDRTLHEWEDGHQCRKKPASFTPESSGSKTA